MQICNLNFNQYNSNELIFFKSNVVGLKWQHLKYCLKVLKKVLKIIEVCLDR